MKGKLSMSIILDFTIRTPIMRHVRQVVPEMDFEALEQRVTDSGVAKIVGAASNGDYAKMEAAFEDDPSVAAYRLLSAEDETRRLYRVTLTPAGKRRMIYLFAVEHDIIFQRMYSTKENMEVRATFPDREAIRLFQSYCEERGLKFRFGRLFEEEPINRQDNSSVGNLSPAQEEALSLAVEYGYFDIPRQTDFEELGDLIGISNQAVSQRVRRGLKAILKSRVSLSTK